MLILTQKTLIHFIIFHNSNQASVMTKQAHTPLIAQYLDIRQHYPDTMLFFQVGDFYELFFQDAVTASQVLAITLTKRGKSNGEDIPLCGVPVHALSHYLVKLVKAGYSVALCEQLSKPQPGTVVKRAVTKVYTPGTLTDDQLLDEKAASYLCTLFSLPNGTQWGIAFTELLTAHVAMTTIDVHDIRVLEAELARFSPDEVVVLATEQQSLLSQLARWGYRVSILREHADQEPLHSRDVLKQSAAYTWIEATLSDETQAVLTAQPALRGATELLYRYLHHNQPGALAQLTQISLYQPATYVTLDAATLRNLAVVQGQDGGTAHTLFAVLDDAQTVMGSRLLKKWLVRPLRSHEQIVRRQEVVHALVSNVGILSQLKEQLRGLADLERMVGRIALGRASVHDYRLLTATLQRIPDIQQVLEPLADIPLLATQMASLPSFSELASLLTRAINTDDDVDGMIAAGYSDKLDQLRECAQSGQAQIQAVAIREGQTYDISSLKILYTSVAGYFIEVTKTHLDKVPEHYRQIQTLANRARFITTELKELEQHLAHAQEHVSELDCSLYQQLEHEVAQWVPALRRAARALATIDVLYGFAQVAYTQQYVVPTFNSEGRLSIAQGRHPIVEKAITESFIANDTALADPDWLWIITGPNMGGKSTYLRQVALICLMAQCGSLVPAGSADVMLVDRIFTRIGAGDNVAQGKSTFLVEMEETATICGQATKESLVILDEVGRGTSTQDGRALAQAIIEYLAQTVRARTLFATHYHELTTLSESLHGIANYHVECVKKGDTLHFLHTLAPGVATASFGIDVAKLAHLPKSIIERARALLTHEYDMPVVPGVVAQDTTSDDSIRDELAQLDLDDLSPRAAFDVVCRLKSKL